MPARFELSKIKPDFDDILNQIVAYKNSLATGNPQVWIDFMTSSAGQVILELLAGTTAFNQYYVETAYREAFPHTALRDSSIYAIARMLGVKIERKRPAAMKIKLLNQSSNYVIISKNSVFLVDSQKFFNRTEISLPPNATGYTTDQYIYEGVVKTKTLASVTGPGDVYLGIPGFIVSSYPGDLLVSVIDFNGILTVWTEAENSLFTYGPTSKVYYSNTSPEGDVVLTFGDSENGSLPSPNDEVRVQYVETQGSKANKAVGTAVGETITIKTNVSYPANNNIKVLVDDSFGSSSGIYGGSDEKPSSYYKTYSPYLYRAKQKSITKTEYISIIMGLGGISSVLVEAQRDINPSRVDLMNVVTVCALPSSTAIDIFTTAQKDSFIKNLYQYIHACIRVDFVDANIIVLYLSITIYVKPTYNTADVKNEVKDRIVKFFEKGPDSLGKSIYLSDLVNLCMVSAVDHCAIYENNGTDIVPFTDKIPATKRNFYRLDEQAMVITSLYTNRSMVTVDTFV